MNHHFIRFIRVIRGSIVFRRANEATICKVSKEPRIKRIARIRLRHEDQACRVRQLLAGTIRVFATQLFVNHLFIRFIRVIGGSIVFRRERGEDFFEARIAAERVPERMQL